MLILLPMIAVGLGGEHLLGLVTALVPIAGGNTSAHRGGT